MAYTVLSYSLTRLVSMMRFDSKATPICTNDIDTDYSYHNKNCRTCLTNHMGPHHATSYL